MLEEKFDLYTSNYDMKDEMVKAKYDHSYRVMNLAVKYAKILNFNEEDIEIARVIGLLHDIGRFEQIKQYHTFNDRKSVDHADYGIKQLFENNLIEEMITQKEWFPIIRFAIQNHNKHQIEECNDERILKHTYLIRDVDKIDILYLLGKLGELEDKADESVISKEMIDSIKNHESLKYTDLQSHDDVLVTKYAYVFDIHYDECLKEFLENLEAYHTRIDGGEEFEKIYLETKKYINERLDKNGN